MYPDFEYEMYYSILTKVLLELCSTVPKLRFEYVLCTKYTDWGIHSYLLQYPDYEVFIEFYTRYTDWSINSYVLQYPDYEKGIELCTTYTDWGINSYVLQYPDRGLNMSYILHTDWGIHRVMYYSTLTEVWIQAIQVNGAWLCWYGKYLTLDWLRTNTTFNVRTGRPSLTITICKANLYSNHSNWEATHKGFT